MSDKDHIHDFMQAFDGLERRLKQRDEARSADQAELSERLLRLEQARAGIGGGMLPDELNALRAESGGLKALRKAEEFRAYYAGMGERIEGDSQLRLIDFMRGIAGMKTTEVAQKALSVGTDTAGGYAVPSITMPGILEAMVAQSATIAAGAGVVPMDSGAKSLTTAIIDTVPQPAWRQENGAVAESDPAFRGVAATPRSLSVMFKISRELLADAVNGEEALRVAIGAAYAKELDRTGLRGSGTAPEPRGVLNTTNVNSVTNGANGTALAGYSNIFSAIQLILEDDAPVPTAAIMSPRSLVKLGGLVDSTGQPVARPPMLQPMQMLATSQIPNNLTVGTSSDCSEIYVGDFKHMAYLQRERLSIELLRERYAENGQLAFMCHARVDVVVLYPKAFSVVTGVRA